MKRLVPLLIFLAFIIEPLSAAAQGGSGGCWDCIDFDLTFISLNRQGPFYPHGAGEYKLHLECTNITKTGRAYVELERDGISWFYSCPGTILDHDPLPIDITFTVNNGFQLWVGLRFLVGAPVPGGGLGFHTVNLKASLEQITSTPTLIPTSTPPAVPSGCYVQQIEHYPIEHPVFFNQAAQVYTYNGLTYYDVGVPIAGNWAQLNGYPVGPALQVNAGYTEIFRASSLTPDADILVCAALPTPTPNPGDANCPPTATDDILGTFTLIYQNLVYVPYYQTANAPYTTGNIFGPGDYLVRYYPRSAATFTAAIYYRHYYGAAENIFNAWGDVPSYQQYVDRADYWGVEMWVNQIENEQRAYTALCIYDAAAPTPTNTSTVTPGSSPTSTSTPSPTRTPVNTPTPTPTGTLTATPSATATTSPTITTTAGPTLGCVSTAAYQVPVSPSTVSATLYNGAQFQVLDAAAYVNLGGQAQPLTPGTIYTWQSTTGDYTFYSLTNPARLFVCLPLGVVTSTSTSTPTSLATATPSLGCGVLGRNEYFIGPEPMNVILYQNALYQVLDRQVLVTVSGQEIPIIGVGLWDVATGNYQVRTAGGTARLLVCVPAGQPTATPAPTFTGLPTALPTAVGTPGTPTCDQCGALATIIAQINTVIARTQLPYPTQLPYNTQLPYPTWPNTATAGASPTVPSNTPTETGTPTNTPTGTLTNTPTPTETGTPTNTPTATITSSLVLIQWSAATVQVGEGAGAITLVVVLTQAQLVPVSVDYSTISGSAIAGSDFAGSGGTITFAPGTTNINIAIPIVDDLTTESDETFSVALADPRPAASSGRGPGLSRIALAGDNVSLGEPSTQVVTIVDNEVLPPGPTELVDVCVIVPPTSTIEVTPFPTLPLGFPTLRPLPALPGAAVPGITTTAATITATVELSSALVLAWAAPVATFTTWSDDIFGPDGAAKGQQDALLISDQIATGLGWLALWTMLGPLAAVLPPLLIRLYIVIARGVLRIARHVRQMWP